MRLANPPSQRVATDVQTGPDLRKDRRRQTLGEDVGILGQRRHVEDVDSTNGNTLPNKVEINLNMFGALVLNQVGCGVQQEVMARQMGEEGRTDWSNCTW